ncbi:MAG: phosphatase PAP2 family protein [Pirellulaceae bacterium]
MLETLNHLDHYFFALINGFAGQSSALDRITLFVRDSYILKGVPVMMAWWGLWFVRGARRHRARTYLITGLFAAIASISVGRLLALTLPFRDRPIHHPELEAILPSGMGSQVLVGWSSFPSDHAVLFFALATAIFVVNRALGLILFLHAAIVISLPRVYSGLHFPSDVLFGALLGVSLSLLIFSAATRLTQRLDLIPIIERYSSVAYPILFFITFQVASMFDSVRALLSFANDILGALIARVG